MKKIEENDLKMIKGGNAITSSMINAFTNIIKVLIDSGKGLGSALRRFGEGKACPLE
ncbi:MAG: hypothetical protein IJH34_14745 [Romboutsia sp.]|nr:hypothetical protein [Romboutsia sp.]